jgi:hypothetical protein
MRQGIIMAYPSGLVKFCATGALILASTQASAAVISLTKLTGTTGTAPAASTAVYGASLSSLAGTIAAISISDASGTFGGAGGMFSGFDLDAIKISTVNCATAGCAAGAPSLAVFNFSSGVIFTPGSQRTPADAKLFGTGPAGTTLNNSVATLGQFDGFSSTGTPDGFISLGDNGSIAFNLTSTISGAGLYLYIGEVGDNGEVAGSNINLLSTPVRGVPEPATWAMMVGGFGLIGAAMRRRQRGIALSA